MRLNHFALIALLATLTACSSGPSLDMDTRETFQASSQEMGEGLATFEEQVQLGLAIKFISQYAAEKMVRDEGLEVNTVEQALKIRWAAAQDALDGMTASEVIERAREIRADLMGS